MFIDGASKDVIVFRGDQRDDTFLGGSMSYQEVDRLNFGDGITASDLYAVKSAVGGGSATDLTIGLKSGDGTITILDYGTDAATVAQYQISQFVFSDGTVLNRNAFMVATMGTSGNDVFDGTGASDDYVFRGGEGHDVIQETSANYQEVDRLVFGAGIVASDVFSFTDDVDGNGIYDLVIGLDGAIGSIAILNDQSTALNSKIYQIDEFRFADGTAMDRDDFIYATLDQGRALDIYG